MVAKKKTLEPKTGARASRPVGRPPNGRGGTKDRMVAAWVTNEEHEKFKRDCEAQGRNMATVLYRLLRAFMDGAITWDQLPQPEGNS